MLSSRNLFRNVPPAILQHLRRAALLGSIAAAALLAESTIPVLAQDHMWSLVPPDAPALAGMQRTSDKTDQVWLTTKNNVQDLNAFVSLTDTDSGRRIDRVIVSAGPAGSDLLGEHLLIAEGSFHRPVNPSLPGRASTFAGVPVQLFDAGTLDAHTASGPRWFAVLDNRIALFGSPAAVQKALLRHTQHAPVDPVVAARFHRIPSNDATWSSVTLDPALLHSKLRLHGYEQTVVPCLAATAELDLGVRLDREAKVDIRIVSASRAAAADAATCLHRLAPPESAMAMRVGWSADNSVVNLSMHGARNRYTQWLDTFREPFSTQLLASAALPEKTGD